MCLLTLDEDKFSEYMESTTKACLVVMESFKNKKCDSMFTYKEQADGFYFDWYSIFKYQTPSAYIAALYLNEIKHYERFTFNTILEYRDYFQSYRINSLEPDFRALLKECNRNEEIIIPELIDYNNMIKTMYNYVVGELDTIRRRCMFNYSLSKDSDELGLYFIYVDTIRELWMYYFYENEDTENDEEIHEYSKKIFSKIKDYSFDMEDVL